MTLLELLVKELPKRGGWPDGIGEIEQNYHGKIFDGADALMPFLFSGEEFERVDAWRTEVVTRKQYEDALAASKQEWNGEGLPPVGTEVEVSVDGGRTWCSYKASSERNGMRIVEIGNFTEEFQSNNWMFRPIRSEADKKRAEGVIALSRVDPNVAPFEYGDKRSDGSLIGSAWYDLYDAIAAGKIPGVKLED